jgi:multimeric flavodoxin WrbA
MSSPKISRRKAIKYVGAASAAAVGAVVGITHIRNSNAATFASASSSTDNDLTINLTNTHNSMKVLLINGSPHREGCTYTALREIADTLEKNGASTEILWLGVDAISGCRGCGACRKLGKCVIDDAVNQTIDRVDTFDGFIIGSPVHYAAASGFITPFLDRLFYAGGNKFAGKPGAAIVSCRRAGSTAAFEQLNKYFTISSMPVVSSQYWNMVHGNTPEEVRKDLEGMQIMRTLGQNMAWLLRCIAAGRAAGIALPVYEKRVGTNFIR